MESWKVGKVERWKALVKHPKLKLGLRKTARQLTSPPADDGCGGGGGCGCGGGGACGGGRGGRARGGGGRGGHGSFLIPG